MLRVSPLLTSTLPRLRPQDVFAATTYSADNTDKTIVTGIDLLARGGTVWGKSRTNSYTHALYSQARGAGLMLKTNATDAETSYGSPGLTGFTSSGFTLGNDSVQAGINYSGGYVAWSFARAPRFYDEVIFTGDGTTGRQIPHGLGIAPGMMTVKRLDSASDWPVYHRALGGSQVLRLNTTDGSIASAAYWNNTDPSASAFTVTSITNISGAPYLARLFAHDQDADSGIINCGIYTEPTTGAGSLQINLGWSPQFFLARAIGGGAWWIFDTARGFGGGLQVSSPSAETNFGANPYFVPNATGIAIGSGFFGAGATVVYLAIRAPIT